MLHQVPLRLGSTRSSSLGKHHMFTTTHERVKQSLFPKKAQTLTKSALKHQETCLFTRHILARNSFTLPAENRLNKPKQPPFFHPTELQDCPPALKAVRNLTHKAKMASSSPPPLPRICVLGSLNIDLVSYVPHHPAPGETLTSTSFAVSPGGKVSPSLPPRQPPTH